MVILKTQLNTARIIILVSILLLLIVSVSTAYYGHIDTGDYADTAKFFAGDYQAKLRTSHSVLYGLIHAPFVKLTGNFLPFKLSSVLFLSLIILSVYHMSNYNKKTLWLILAAPIIWYMAPWANPIQISSLLLLWAYYFIDKYRNTEKENLKYLAYSGIFLGLSWAFWEAALYFAVLLGFCFLYDKKLTHSLYFLTAIFIGILSKLIIDQFLFGFAFYSVSKHFFALASSALYGGIYNNQGSGSILEIIFILLIFPIYSWLFYKRKIFSVHKNKIIFLTLSLLLILINAPQIRCLLIITPIAILYLGEILNEKQFKIQIIIFLIISLLVINPYLIQIKYQTNGEEFSSFISNLFNLELSSNLSNEALKEDLNKIAKDYPNQQFIVGPLPDDYQKLAHLYWGKEIKEFVSIQDYQLHLNNETSLAEKTLCSKSKSWNRRDICVSLELRKTISDNTEYDSINYAISSRENLTLQNFKLIKRYGILSVFEKE